MSTPSSPHPPGGPDRIDYQETPDITEVHAAIQREHKEPTAETTPIPMWLSAVCGVAMVWAGTYFGVFNGGLSGSIFNEYESSPAALFPRPTKGAGGAVAEAPQSLAQIGKGVYGQCVACHGATGQGNAATNIPPVAASEWVTGSEKRLVAIMLKGLSGPITVAGKLYAGGVMPGWEASLNDKKIAAVASYTRANFGNNAPEISEAKVKAARAEFADRKAPWTEAELKAIPEDATLPDDAAAAAPAPAVAPVAAPAPAPGAPTPAAAPVAAASPELLAEGKKNYMMTCVACHQPNGAGLPMVFPPLTKSEYVSGSAERFAAMILKGNAGPMTVHGKPYNNMMPGQEAMLDDAKIASIMTYVRASFENNAGPVGPEVVAAARAKYTDRKTPWIEAELKAWK